jgi:hypothetical protein
MEVNKGRRDCLKFWFPARIMHLCLAIEMHDSFEDIVISTERAYLAGLSVVTHVFVETLCISMVCKVTRIARGETR